MVPNIGTKVSTPPIEEKRKEKKQKKYKKDERVLAKEEPQLKNDTKRS